MWGGGVVERQGLGRDLLVKLRKEKEKNCERIYGRRHDLEKCSVFQRPPSCHGGGKRKQTSSVEGATENYPGV